MKGRWKHRTFYFPENARGGLLNRRIEPANLHRMSSRTFVLCAAFLALATVMIESRRADASSELRVGELFAPLRDRRFSESPEQFDPTMTGGVSADQMWTLWLQTLAVPASSGPFRAAILLAGSGPNDRDETIGPNHVFKDLAEGLSSRGIAVLRCDKRTYAYRGTLDPQKITVDEEVIQDGVAAVSLMRARPEVAQDKIFVVGHSLGAMLAPEIAKQARPVAGNVMLAPLGPEAAQTIVEQMRFLGQVSP